MEEEKRGPGRPRKIAEEDSRSLTGDIVAQKRKRVPIHESRDVLAVRNPDPRKTYRFVRDYPQGNIRRFMDAGWEFVVDKELDIADKSIDGTRAPGNVVSKLGDPKHGTMLYLMCIDKDLYKEDQKVKQTKLDEIDKQLGIPEKGFYGKQEVVIGRGFKEPT